MENKDSRISQILAHLASAATVAAGGVNDAVQSAGNTVSEKYKGVKLNMELNRLQDEQAKLFADIGRTMFLIKAGRATELKTEEDEVLDAQDTVDKLLAVAEEKQKSIDEIADEISALSGEKLCDVCGKVNRSEDQFCPKCGNKLAD